MREAVLLANMLLEAKAAMVLYGPKLPENGLYFHADSDQALSDKMTASLRPLVRGLPEKADLDTLLRVLQQSGYQAISRGVAGAKAKRTTARTYGQGMQVTPRSAQLLGIKSASAVRSVSDPFGRAEKTTAGRVLKGAVAGEKPGRRLVPGYVGFTAMTNQGPTPGIRISDVEANSPARDGRIRRGDIITAGRTTEAGKASAWQDIRSMDGYMRFIRTWKAGQGVQFKYARGDRDGETQVIYPVPPERGQTL